MSFVNVWRIVKEEHVLTAFSGIGAKLYPGRWNMHGDSVVYTAGSESLAVLEMLVHLNKATKLPSYVLLQAKVPHKLIETPSQFPPGWNHLVAPQTVADFGSEWFRSGRSCVMRVPSVLAASEFNYLINPQHLSFATIMIGAPQSFQFDPRLQ